MWPGSLVGVCKQDYKSLCAAVTICATVVNVQTQTLNILEKLLYRHRRGNEQLAILAD